MIAVSILSYSSSTSSGMSEEAQYVRDFASEGRGCLQESTTLGLGSGVFEELDAIAEECSQPDWDGYGALPVTMDAVLNAHRFLEALPLGTPAPSAGAEPDGHVTLEWHVSPRRTFSVSISPEGDLYFSGLFGPKRMSGAEPFFDEIPARILDLIHRVFGE